MTRITCSTQYFVLHKTHVFAVGEISIESRERAEIKGKGRGETAVAGGKRGRPYIGSIDAVRRGDLDFLLDFLRSAL